MRDPFPIAPPAFLQQAVQPVADALSLPTLPLHFHEILFALALYTFIDTIASPYISAIIFPKIYPYLDKRTKINWNVHVVSLVQSIVICALAIYLMLYDEERKEMNWAGRIWGYTGAGGLLQAMATGYFLWDFVVTLVHLDIFGVGLLAHAVSALTVFSFGYRPFVNYYGPIFLLYELSTPFLNIHWFCDKLKLTGSNYQLVNGIFLITTFFCSRLLWGMLNSCYVFYDVWVAWQNGSLVCPPNNLAASKLGLEGDVPAAQNGSVSPNVDVMRFAGECSVPLWLAASYMTSNIVLNILNIHWLGRMIETIRKRFEPAEKAKREDAAVAPVIQRGVYENGRKTVEVEGKEIRSRRRG